MGWAAYVLGNKPVFSLFNLGWISQTFLPFGGGDPIIYNIFKNKNLVVISSKV